MSLNKRLISTGAAAAAACSTDSTDPFGDSSGVALYNLDYDASTAPDGTDYSGSPTDVDFGVDGQINYGARFNGSSSRIALPKLTGLTADVSVSGWVNLGNTTTSNRIRFIEINTDANGYAGTLSIYYKPSNGEWQVRSGNGTSSNSNVLTHTYTLTQSTWYHVCFTRDDSTNVTKFYINGSLQDTETVSVSSSYPSGATGVIGDLNYSAGANYNWLGEIDQVRIFSKALNETTNGEVSALYAETVCVYTATTTDSDYPTTNAAYYKLDNSAEDSKGTNDGTEYNIEYRFGRFGQAAVFNGSSSKIDLGNNSSNNSSVISVSLWFKTAGHSGTAALINNGGANSGETGYFLGLTSNGYIRLNLSASVDGTINYADGNWHNVVMTLNNGSYNVYIDGNTTPVLTGSQSFTGTATRPTWIGQFSYTASNLEFFDGSLDQV